MASKGLVHVRIDDRLIHGQVAVYWCNAVGATRIMLANDAMYDNEVQKAALRLAVPAGLKSSFLDVKTAASNLAAGKYAGQRVILVVRRPSDVLRLIDAGVEIDAVNVGNVPAREGTVSLYKTINLLPEEIEEVKELNNRGVNLTGKMVPDNSDEDLMITLNKF